MGETVQQYDRTRNFRLTAAEDDAIEELARQEDMPVSTFIRRTLRRALFLPVGGSNTPVAGRWEQHSRHE